VPRNLKKSDPIREATLHALDLVLDPLLDLMFDVGLSVQELNHLIRSGAVRVASRRLLRDGGRLSKSRIAIITGIPRSEVTKLSKLANKLGEAKINEQPARRVLTGWASDPKFQGVSGDPEILPIFGSGRSFEKLVSLYGAGIPVRAMLDELIHLGVVERLPKQRIGTKARVPSFVGMSPDAIKAAGEHCKDLLGTLTQSLRRAERPLFQATSLISDADPRMLPAIRRQIAAQGRFFLNSASSVLKRSRAKKKGLDAEARRIGVTIYFFEGSASFTTDLTVPGKPRRRTNLRRQLLPDQ
jgi:hypothetical protein